MLARIRNPKTNIINILISDFNMQINGLFDIIPFQKYYNIMFGDESPNGLSFIKCYNKWETDCAKYWLDVFKWYALRKGHTFEIVSSSKEDFKQANEKLNETKKYYEVTLPSREIIEKTLTGQLGDASSFSFLVESAAMNDNIIINELHNVLKQSIFSRYEQLQKILNERDHMTNLSFDEIMSDIKPISGTFNHGQISNVLEGLILWFYHENTYTIKKFKFNCKTKIRS